MTEPHRITSRTRQHPHTNHSTPNRKRRVPTGRKLRIVPPDVVKAAIARALRGQVATAQLGSLKLLPHQQDAVARLHTTLRELRIALLADDVGLGKTYVALAVAREYTCVHIIAPAALIPMWRTAVARAQVAHVTFQSVQSYSRTPAHHPPAQAAPGSGRVLFIIDEAHHLRTPTTRRYRSVANAVSGHDVLLLSATPIHNSPADLRTVLGLSLGARANRLSQALLSRVVVRRSIATTMPAVVEHEPTRVPHDPAILNAILALPAPLPAHDGAVAGALIRMGLLRAWCSSDAALIHTLRQRLLRGEALRQALLAGRHPSSSELRSWLVGDHEVQLAFPELMAQHTPATGPLLEVLDTHLNAVHNLLAEHRRNTTADLARVRAIKALMAAHPDTPIVAFSQFAETVRAIGRALSDIAGVGVLTGQRATIASGTITRAEALEHFAPVAQGRPPPPHHQRIWLLLTTDLLAEGVNLQDAGVIVHLDLPWTNARTRQRTGRCVRMGSPHHTVHVYTMAPHAGAESVLRVYDRLQRKASAAEQLIGLSQVASDPRKRGAVEVASDAHRLITTWSDSRHRAPHGTSTMPVAAIAAPATGFLAVVSVTSHVSAPDEHCVCTLVVGGRLLPHTASSAPRWKIGTGMRLLLRLARCVSINNVQHTVQRSAVNSTIRRLQRWARHQAIASSVGVNTDARTGVANVSLSAVHTRIASAIQSGLLQVPPASRVALRPAIHVANAVVESARGAGAEAALTEWFLTRRTMPFAQWLLQWREFPVLVQSTAHPERGASRDDIDSPTALKVHSLLLLMPP